jgi:predicted Zn-dependent protease
VRIVRALSLLLALVLCAWFALGIRQARDTSQATSILSNRNGVSGAQAAHAGSLLSAAKMLNPDAQVDLLRGRVALAENDRPVAVRIVEDVTRREPMNLQAWLLFAETTLYLPDIKLAVARVAALDPRLTIPRRR